MTLCSCALCRTLRHPSKSVQSNPATAYSCSFGAGLSCSAGTRRCTVACTVQSVQAPRCNRPLGRAWHAVQESPRDRSTERTQGFHQSSGRLSHTCTLRSHPVQLCTRVCTWQCMGPAHTGAHHMTACGRQGSLYRPLPCTARLQESEQSTDHRPHTCSSVLRCYCSHRHS